MAKKSIAKKSTRSVAPTLMALMPPAAPLGAPNFTLHVFGSGFVDGDTILWNGSPEPTTFISAHQLATGVNMATAEVALPIPVKVQTADGATSNALTFALGEDVPPLPSLPPPKGFVLLTDAYAHPILVATDAVVGIEDTIEVADATGPLYGKSPAAAYRRLTLAGGVQFFVGAGSVGPLLKKLG